MNHHAAVRTPPAAPSAQVRSCSPSPGERGTRRCNWRWVWAAFALAVAGPNSGEASAQHACDNVSPGGGGAPVYSYTYAIASVNDRDHVPWVSNADGHYLPNAFGVTPSTTSVAWTDPAGGDLWTASATAACLYPDSRHFVLSASGRHVGSHPRDLIGAGGVARGRFRTTWRLSHPTLSGYYRLHASYRIDIPQIDPTTGNPPIAAIRTNLLMNGFACVLSEIPVAGASFLPLTPGAGMLGSWGVPFEVEVLVSMGEGGAYQQAGSATSTWRLHIDRVVNGQGQEVSGWTLIDSGLNRVIASCAGAVCIADTDDGSGTGTPDCGVTIDDLLYYLFIFEVGELRADVDDGSNTGTPDGGVTIDDLLYYLQRFEAGC